MKTIASKNSTSSASITQRNMAITNQQISYHIEDLFAL